MLGFSKRTITLDMDSSAIRILVMKGRRIEKWATSYLEPGIIEGGVVLEPPALGAKVKQLMDSSQIKGSKVIASLSGLYSISHILHIPVLDGQTVAEAVVQTARQAMPDPESYHISWNMIAINELERQALVFGIPHDVIDAEVKALRSVKVNPYIVNLKGMALLRLIDREQALVVNKEPESMDIVLIANGIPYVMYTMHLKNNMNIGEWVEFLGHTLSRTIYFHNSQNPMSPVGTETPIFLTGQLPGYLKVVQMVQDKTRHPIAPLVVPLDYPPNLPVFQYAVNIGLAMQQISTSTKVEDEQSIAEN